MAGSGGKRETWQRVLTLVFVLLRYEVVAVDMGRKMVVANMKRLLARGGGEAKSLGCSSEYCTRWAL